MSKRNLFIFLMLGISMFIVCTSVRVALAQPVKTCIDDYTLQVNTTYDIEVNGNITSVDVSKNVYCPGGCLPSINDCQPVSASRSAMGMPLSIYIFLEAATILIFIGVYSNFMKLQKEGRVTMSILVLVLFAFLTFASFRMEMTDGTVVHNTTLVVLNLLFAILSVLNLIGIFFMKSFQPEQE